MINVTYLTLFCTLIFTLFLFLFPTLIKNNKIQQDISIIERYPYLDALRGIIATMVFVHHSMFVYNLYSVGSWTPDGIFNYSSTSLHRAYIHFGQSAVMIFFMITGFLFFDKILYSNGYINALDFYKKRIKRLLPAMISCFILAIIVCSLVTGSIPELTLKSVLTWLSFGFLPLDQMNGMFGYLLVAGVFWTLVFEVKFYILVPSLSLISNKKNRVYLNLIFTSLIIYFIYHYEFIDKKDYIVIMCFISGMLSASILKLSSEKTKEILRKSYISILVILLLIFNVQQEDISYDYKILFSLFLLFLIISSGNNLFGLLKLNALKLAGKCSYSIYIMHGLVLNLVAGYILKGYNYYSVIIMSAVILMFISLLNYYLIEKPFLKK